MSIGAEPLLRRRRKTRQVSCDSLGSKQPWIVPFIRPISWDRQPHSLCFCRSLAVNPCECSDVDVVNDAGQRIERSQFSTLYFSTLDPDSHSSLLLVERCSLVRFLSALKKEDNICETSGPATETLNADKNTHLEHWRTIN